MHLRHKDERDTRAPLTRQKARLGSGGWQARAIDAHRQNWETLTSRLTGAILRLTGRTVGQETVYVAGEQAVVWLDGVLFQLATPGLSVVRPCVGCGLGAYRSPPIHDLAGLGFALDAWEPRCPHCAPEDSNPPW